MDLRFGFPELVIIFVIALFLFGPRALPRLGKGLDESMQDSRQRRDDETHTPVLIFLFKLLLALAFVYGFLKTVELFR